MAQPEHECVHVGVRSVECLCQWRYIVEMSVPRKDRKDTLLDAYNAHVKQTQKR